jgi:hypothetical protein
LENEIYLYCITFCWTRQLFNTTLIGPVALEDGSYLYLYYILPDKTVIKQYIDWSHGISRTGVMCTCITFYWTRQLFNTTLIVPMVFGERELCVLVIHSAEPDVI